MSKIAYHLKSAASSIKRNFAMSLSSAIAVTVTLTLIMLFLVIAANINTMSNKVEKSVEIYAQIDLIVEEKDYDALQKQIEALDYVKSVRFSSKDEQKEIFLSSDMGGEEYKVMFEEGNPLSAAFYVDADSGEYVSSLAKQIGKLNGITSAEFGGESATKMLEAFDSIKIGGSIFVLALCFLAIFLISNTIKITIKARKEELSIMRNVGASNGFIKIPFMLEGMMIGFIGAIIPVVITIFGYGIMYDVMGGAMFSNLFPLIKPMPFVLLVSLGLVLLGMLVGIIGSLLSVNKEIKWKR